MTIAVAVALAFVVPKYADADSVKRLIQTADSSGYSHSRVVCFRTLSHNAEFYAAGRLIRRGDGKQIRFDEADQIEELAANSVSPILILVPVKQLESLTSDPELVLNVIADNTDLAIAAVSLR
jgi:hypothetical protein